MAKTQTHNSPSHEAMVKGRQISYQISNSRGSGHSPPYKVKASRVIHAKDRDHVNIVLACGAREASRQRLPDGTTDRCTIARFRYAARSVVCSAPEVPTFGC